MDFQRQTTTCTQNLLSYSLEMYARIKMWDYSFFRTLLEQHDVTVFVVGVTDDVTEAEARDISSDPKLREETYWLTENAASLTSHVDDVAQKLYYGTKQWCIHSSSIHTAGILFLRFTVQVQRT